VVLRRGADGDAATEVAYRLARFDLRITTSASRLDVVEAGWRGVTDPR
jgi:hypothetical protein